MALPPLADLSALLARVARALSDKDTARATALLDDVSAEVREVTGRTWCDSSGDLDPDRPAMLAVITLRAAERAVRNPSGLHAEGIGDYRRTFAEGLQPVGVFLTEGETEVLERIVGIEGIVSVPVQRDVMVSDVVWLPDQYGGDRIPWQVPL